MNPAPSLREQIDACRPGSDDLSLPALAELAQAAQQDRAVADGLDRAQRFDRAVISALHDVPVPGDLLERLLAQATAAGPATTVVPVGAATRGSRRWILALASLAAAALLAVGIWQLIDRQPRSVVLSELADAAVQWQAENSAIDEWRPHAGGVPHRAVRIVPSRSRAYQTAHGPAEVYELRQPPSRTPALLFKVRTRDRFAVGETPFTKVPATGGLSVGAWQQGDFLYVLIVVPHGQQIEDFVGPVRAA